MSLHPLPPKYHLKSAKTSFRHFGPKFFIAIALAIFSTGCSRQLSSQVGPALKNEPMLNSSISSSLIHYASTIRKELPNANSVLLLETGSEALLSRIHLIRSARTSISIQTFIWANDETGRLFMYELMQAAKRGVKVRFLIDQLASESHIDLNTFSGYEHPNLSIKFFNPGEGFFNQPKARTFFLEKLYAVFFKFRTLNHRMHNKLFLVDDLIAITGGRNYQNAYYDLAAGMNYKDRDIMATGPVVKDMSKSFEEYWNSSFVVELESLTDYIYRVEKGQIEGIQTRAGFLLNGLYKKVSKDLAHPSLVEDKFVKKFIPVEKAFYVADKPHKKDRILVFFGGDSETTHHLAEVVSKAKESIVIQSPYLVLSTPAISLFKKIRLAYPDIDIRISTNSLAATDSWHVYALSYKQKQKYLQTLGFKIYEFKPLPADLLDFAPELNQRVESMSLNKDPTDDFDQPYLCLHGKSMIVDNEVSFVGSYNLDPRSQNLNTESGLFIVDKSFAMHLQGLIQKDMAARNSWVVAKKKIPLGLGVPNAFMVKLSDLFPLIDVWPLRYTSLFDLIPGKQEVPPEDPGFYLNYKDVGSFPQIDSMNIGKEIGARGTKAFLSIVKPLL
jgi:phosphatidylserine/phosphatidylglycerophosphate/cardiolipin synthase-like enzyme